MYQATVKDQGAQLLAAMGATPAPVPIRYTHLWKAAKTLDDAFEFDPLMLYIADGKRPSRAARRARNFIALSQWKTRKTTLTVNNGSALVVAFLDLDGPKTPFERLFDFIAPHVWRFFAGKPTAEQQKRLDESDTKMRFVIDGTIGDRICNMILINLLATEPASQGRGYGGSLVEAVNDIADSSGKASWLLAIDANEPFYNSHGYTTVGTYYMGESNPNWTQKPIPINLMVREAQTKSETPTRKRSIKAFNLKSVQSPFQFLI